MARPRREPPDPSDLPLTAAEQTFVNEYLIDLDRVRAYMAAHPPCRSRNAAAVEACKCLKKPNVAAEIRAARADQRRRCRISAAAVLRELARAAFSDIGDLFADDGTVRPLRDVPLNTRRALADYRAEKETITRTAG